MLRPVPPSVDPSDAARALAAVAALRDARARMAAITFLTELLHEQAAARLHALSRILTPAESRRR